MIGQNKIRAGRCQAAAPICRPPKEIRRFGLLGKDYVLFVDRLVPAGERAVGRVGRGLSPTNGFAAARVRRRGAV